MVITMGGLMGAAAYALANGVWAPVLLVIALICVADFKPQRKRLVFATTFFALSAIFQPATTVVCFLVSAVWMLWEFGVLGGADVKLLLVAGLVFGSPTFLVPVLLVGGVQGVIARLQRKTEIPFVVSIFCGTFLYVIYSLI